MKTVVDDAEAVRIGAPTVFEAGMVLTSRLGAHGRHMLVGFLVSSDAEVVAFGSEHWPLALDAFARYGKGRHPARLNLGDCQSYAVAKLAREPLLFVGDDFRQTDIQPAL